MTNCFKQNDIVNLKKKLNLIILKKTKANKIEDNFIKEENYKKFCKSSKNIRSQTNILNFLKEKRDKKQLVKKQLQQNPDVYLPQNEGQNKLDKKEINKINKATNGTPIKDIIEKKNDIVNPENLDLYIQLTNDSYSDYILDNTFAVFTSIDDITILIYANKKRSIISYNIIDNKKIIEIKNAHKRDITNFLHFLDKLNNRDLIISISLNDNNIKIWDAIDFNCLINLENVNKTGLLFSACLLSHNAKNYIITSNAYGNNESIKVFDFSGNISKEINDSIDNVYFIDIFFNKKESTNYILTGNNGYIKSYNYDDNKLYHKYDDNDQKRHCSIIIKDEEETAKIIESSFDGNIRIWNFHSGTLINKINVSNSSWLFGICLWNNEYLFVGCGNKAISLIELKTGLIKRNFIGFKSKIICLKKLKHPLLGECLISQGYEQEQIKLFTNSL